MTANQRKRRRRQNPIDCVAERQGQAIEQAFTCRTMDFGKRMNRYYYCDGDKFNTGKRHRAAGGMTAIEHKPKHKPNRASKQRNLKSENVHKRIENPTLYQHHEERLAQHLIEYRAGLVRPINNTL